MTCINIHSLCSLLFFCNDVVFFKSFLNSSPQVQSIWITTVSAQPFSDPFRHIQSGSSMALAGTLKELHRVVPKRLLLSWLFS